MTTKQATRPLKRNHRAKSRLLEGDYLAAMGTACDIGTWTEIVLSTVEQAKGGDFRARDFLARWLLPKDKSLLEIAYEERNGISSEKQVSEFKPHVIK